MDPQIDLTEELEKLEAMLGNARRFLPPHLRDQLEMIRRSLKRGAVQQQTRLDAAEGALGGDPGLSLFAEDPKAAADELAGWARGEDPAIVGRVLDAIRGGHASDLAMIL
jgi:hypothetical protein